MKSSYRNFFSFYAFIAASLTIFANQSEALKQNYLKSRDLKERNDRIILVGRAPSYAQEFQRQQLAQLGSSDAYMNLHMTEDLVARGLEATGAEEDATPSNLLHLNLQELSLDCQDGCKAALALITSDQCNTAEAQDSALEFTLEEEITVDKTHIESDEDAPDYGWATKPFRELIDKSTDNTATDDSSPPITMAEFVTAAAMVSEVIDAMTPDEDFNLAVYLYNNETEPLACTTLELVTEEEELQEYYALFGGGDGGEDGSDVVEGEPVAADGNDSSPLAGGLLAYAVAGVSAVMSAILFA